MFKVPFLLPYFLKNIRLSSFLQLIVVKELETATPQRRDQDYGGDIQREEGVGDSGKEIWSKYQTSHEDIPDIPH